MKTFVYLIFILRFYTENRVNFRIIKREFIIIGSNFKESNFLETNYSHCADFRLQSDFDSASGFFLNKNTNFGSRISNYEI